MPKKGGKVKKISRIHRIFLPFKKPQGMGLIMVMGLMSAMFIFGSAMSTLVLQRVQLQQDFLRQTAEIEMVESAFAVLEVALERRRWEPPSDDDCLAMETFKAEVELEPGRTLIVEATYNPITRQYWMRASVPSVGGGEVVASKAINMVDMSDFLLLNMGTAETRLSRGIVDYNLPVGFIARDRRLQTRGKLVFESIIARDAFRSGGFSDPRAMRIPIDLGTVVQAERMVINGGIEYLRNNTYGIPRDDLALHPILKDYREDGIFLQRAISPGILTGNFGFARSLYDGVRNNDTSLLPDMSDIHKAAYPIALFCDVNRPMDANNASDTGCYHGNPDDWVRFHYVNQTNSAHVINGTCMSVGDVSCSHSEAFPQSFNQWRSNASLQGILYTSDGESVGRKPLDWDTFDSYREDAEKCGVVVTALSGSDGSYEDCDISDFNLVEGYRLSPGTNPCSEIYVLDMENLAGKFSVASNAADLIDPDKRDLILPRVVYSEVPLELLQSSGQGLMVGDIGGAAARANFALNVVSEEKVILRPAQVDISSPLYDPPGTSYMRQVHFNSDALDDNPLTYTQPIKLGVISPESLQAVTPQYMPIDYPGLLDMLPVSGGKLIPSYHMPTDWRRQDNDGFRYGLRELVIRNLAQITGFSSGTVEHPPIYLKGLWSAKALSISNYVSQACMYADPGDTAGIDGFYYNSPGFGVVWTPIPIPNYAKVADPNVPPPLSPFYGGKDEVPEGYMPEVFNVQRRDGLGWHSSVDFSGVVLRPEFSGQVIPGKRRLDTQKHKYIDSQSSFPWSRVNVDDRFVFLNSAPFWQDTSAAESCGGTNILFNSGTVQRFTLSGLSRGSSVQINSPPTDNFRRVGAIFHSDLPLISGEQ